jgi:hypothetical protein
MAPQFAPSPIPFHRIIYFLNLKKMHIVCILKGTLVAYKEIF